MKKILFIDHSGVLSNFFFYGDYDKFYCDDVLFSKTNIRYMKKIISFCKKRNIEILSISSYNFHTNKLIDVYNKTNINYINIIDLQINNVIEDEYLLSHIIQDLNKNEYDYIILDDHDQLYNDSDKSKLVLLDRMKGLNKYYFKKIIKLIKEIW